MASRVPIQRSTGEPPGRECIQVQPIPASHRGRKKAVKPSVCSKRSLRPAPKRPIQLRTAWGAAAPEAVFSEGSEGWYVASARRSRSETSSSTSPRNTFQGRLRVGMRTMRIGFMAGALPLVGRSGTFRERADGADEESQSSFYYPCPGGGFWAKEGGGNLGVDPRRGLWTLCDDSHSPQNLNAAHQTLVICQYAVVQSSSNRAQENIDWPALHSVILTEIEQMRGLDIIGGCNFFIAKRFEQLFSLGELHLIPYTGQYLLADRADDGGTAVLNSFPKLREHLLLVRVDPGLIPAPKRKRPYAGVDDLFQRSSTSIRSSCRIFL